MYDSKFEKHLANYHAAEKKEEQSELAEPVVTSSSSREVILSASVETVSTQASDLMTTIPTEDQDREPVTLHYVELERPQEVNFLNTYFYFLSSVLNLCVLYVKQPII